MELMPGEQPPRQIQRQQAELIRANSALVHSTNFVATEQMQER